MAAYVALLLIQLHFPDAGSLKAKRKDVQSVKAQLHGRFGAAVAEVDHQDLWQRATLSAAFTGGSLSTLERAVDAACSWLDDRFPQGVRIDRTVRSFEELGEVG